MKREWDTNTHWNEGCGSYHRRTTRTRCRLHSDQSDNCSSGFNEQTGFRVSAGSRAHVLSCVTSGDSMLTKVWHQETQYLQASWWSSNSNKVAVSPAGAVYTRETCLIEGWHVGAGFSVTLLSAAATSETRPPQPHTSSSASPTATSTPPGC